ncbi:MAG: hypothetical protein HYX67_04735, partial [Candidatus Melainabacteria bacterium]|nr:hypothetical protein [Candidatus Melainabacteria bacterium]
EAELKGYAGHLEFLHEALIERLNDYNLAAAKKDVVYPLDNAVFAIEAWIPVNKIPILYDVIDGMAVHCELIQTEETDKVPTYMENKGVNAIGEDLVKIYDIPATTDKDPSGWVFWAFTLFFAMIVADGGYGLLYLGICLYFLFRYPDMKQSSRRFLKLATILSTACIIWGVFTAAFFGIEFSPKSWINKVSALEYLADKKADYHVAQKDDVYQAYVKQFPAISSATTGVEFLEGSDRKRRTRGLCDPRCVHRQYPLRVFPSDRRYPHLLVIFALLVEKMVRLGMGDLPRRRLPLCPVYPQGYFHSALHGMGGQADGNRIRAPGDLRGHRNGSFPRPSPKTVKRDRRDRPIDPSLRRCSFLLAPLRSGTGRRDHGRNV